jgi:hypothetical protein
MHRQVLESLIADPSRDLCPLASIVGVSDGFSSAIPDNVRDRASPHIYSLDVQHGTDDYLRSFAIRYLDTLRTPLAQLDQAPDRAVTSACRGCEYNRVGECHGAFGALGDGEAAVGLFPFNSHALEVMYRKAHNRDREKSDFNPRQFLAGVLTPALIEAVNDFAAGRYPPKVLRDRYVDAAPKPGEIATLDQKFGARRGDQAEALQAVWGANLPPAVYVAFGLTAAKVPEAIVPVLTGQPFPAAEQAARVAKLQLTVVETANHLATAERPSGYIEIATQSPAAGQKVPAGSVVDVRVVRYHKGELPPEVDVPHLVGRSLSDATAAAAAAGLRVAVRTLVERAAAADAGLVGSEAVTDQAPLANSRAQPAGVVHVDVVRYVAAESQLPETLRRALDDLDQFHAGGKVGLNTLKLLRSVVRSAVLSRINWNKLFMEQLDWSGPGEFPDEYVNLEESGMPGQLGGPADRRLTIPRKYPDRSDLDPAVGLQGLLLAHHFGGWDFTHATQSGRFYLRHASPVVDGLADEAAARLLRQFAPREYDLPAAGLELLAVAARLQHDLDPGVGEPVVAAALFAEQTNWGTDPADPNRSWDELHRAFNQNFARLRERVISALNCAKEAGRAVVLDAERVFAAVGRWSRRHGKPGEPVPKAVHTHWAPLTQVRKVVDQHLAAAVKGEVEAWAEWVIDVDAQLDGSDASALLEAGRQFFADSTATYRCSLKSADLDRHANRSRVLAGLRITDGRDRPIDRTQLAQLEADFTQALAAQGRLGEPAGESAFAEALAAARQVRHTFAVDPERLDMLLPLVARCRANAGWVQARAAWWGYTIVLAAAVAQTAAGLKGTDGSDTAPSRKKVRDLLAQIEEDAKAVRGVLQ